MARRYKEIRHRKPLIVICSEGGVNSTEHTYFKNYSDRNLRIQFSTGNSTDPKGMLEDLLKYIEKEDIKSEDFVRIFLVLDTDLNEKRIKEIKQIEGICNKNNIEIIISNPTFEIWFLMHYRSNKLKFATSKDVKKELAKLNGEYSETMDIYTIIQDKTNNAKLIAKKIEQQAVDNQEDIFKLNPYTGVFKIIEVIEKLKEQK